MLGFVQPVAVEPSGATAGVAGTEAWFREWLFEEPSDREISLDMGGAFLMGFWPHCGVVRIRCRSGKGDQRR